MRRSPSSITDPAGMRTERSVISTWLTNPFLAVAAIFGITLYELYPRFQSGNVGAGKMAVTVCFMVLFAYFGVSSFWRVRKKNLTERS